jgi:hypothetical protein
LLEELRDEKRRFVSLSGSEEESVDEQEEFEPEPEFDHGGTK